MKDEILKHLYDVREAAGAIIRFIENKTFDDYEQDELFHRDLRRYISLLIDEIFPVYH